MLVPASAAATTTAVSATTAAATIAAATAAATTGAAAATAAIGRALLEAIAAVYGPVAARLKRNFRLLATVRALRRVHLARAG
jgi:hypothetical protein